jgi:hypothetical protein
MNAIHNVILEIAYIQKQVDTKSKSGLSDPPIFTYMGERHEHQSGPDVSAKGFVPTGLPTSIAGRITPA